MMIGKANQLDIISRSKKHGFTLIELLIALAVLGILAAIVVPSYNHIIMTNNRGDAVTALGQIAQDLERCRSDTLAYDDAACMADYANPITPGRGLYTFTVNSTPTTFTITATPVAGTTQAKDSECSEFSYNQAGVKAAEAKDSTPTTADCWKE